tara:strand:- start:199 stop:1176 length:978 start_codon:yes stop_codon:yes gene_type:complete
MTEHAPEQIDAEFQVEKLTPDLVSKIVRVDITQPEILSQRWDLQDCTFIIPLRIETKDRMRNIIVTLIYLLRNFNTKIIVKEVDKESIFKQSVLPALEEACEDFRMEGLTHIFEQSDEYTFHRTKIINDMLWMVDTPIVCNYDCDVLLPKTSYPYAVNMIMNGIENARVEGETWYPKVVYPYGRGVYQAQLNTNDEEVTEFINSKFDFEVFKNWRPYDAKFGFCQFFDTETYKELGGENEGFVSYGYEDDERHYRFAMITDAVARMDERIFHLEHARSKNSWFNNPHIEGNRKLWEKLKSCKGEELKFYYETVGYAKERRAIPVT